MKEAIKKILKKSTVYYFLLSVLTISYFLSKFVDWLFDEGE